MEVIVERAGALDIHKRSIVACVRVPDGGGGRAEQVRTFAAFLGDLEALRGWLLEHGVTQVAMEATSSYWLPVWRVLEEPVVFDQLLLCNAKHVKHVPGRKTDVKDAQWLCQLLEAGLLAGSFVPPPPGGCQMVCVRAGTRHHEAHASKGLHDEPDDRHDQRQPRRWGHVGQRGTAARAAG